jgi:imidazoleglycerol-phosphate dehydratase
MTDMHRIATVTRTTKETDITVTIDLDGTGKTDIDTGVPFFDHMLDAFGRHGLFDLTVHAKGDIEIDAHHTVEDTGIVLGQAIDQALGDKRGIVRYGSIALPMDETLILAAIDLSGRGQAHLELDPPIELLGNFNTTLADEFFIALAANARTTLHLRSFFLSPSEKPYFVSVISPRRFIAATVSLNLSISKCFRLQSRSSSLYRTGFFPERLSLLTMSFV